MYCAQHLIYDGCFTHESSSDVNGELGAGCATFIRGNTAPPKTPLSDFQPSMGPATFHPLADHVFATCQQEREGTVPREG